jgi:hypothetical protein
MPGLEPALNGAQRQKGTAPFSLIRFRRFPPACLSGSPGSACRAVLLGQQGKKDKGI